jgi:peptidoglycan/xylan/chitin deacetylase (PgdA/CDA1 family)
MPVASRFQDHWKLPDQLTAHMPVGAPGEAADGPPPRPGRYRGTPIWIHPGAEAIADRRFATDDGTSGFLPDDAIANVQLERYVPRSEAGGRREARLKELYYRLKPCLPRALQLEAQRWNARARLRAVDYPRWPADESLTRLLSSLLARLLELSATDDVPFIGFWPRGYTFAACFTHDVETGAGLSGLERMATIEDERGIRSTWFIVPERYRVSPADFAALRRAGHEIGVHGLDHSCRTFASREAFEHRAPRINRYIRDWQVVGYRSPALYRNPDWIPELDIRYDSSFMDTAVLEPQRGGVSAPFPFHLRHVVELPITMPMDHHLIHLLRRATVPGMLAKLRWVVERFGLANFLFHPDYNLAAARLSDYRQVLDEVRALPGGWIATAAQIADWWSRRRASRVVLDGDVPRIEGPCSADGALWMARRDGATVKLEPAESAAVWRSPPSPPAGPSRPPARYCTTRPVGELGEVASARLPP